MSRDQKISMPIPAPGDWVALSPDESEIAASSARLSDLEVMLTNLGRDPQQVVYMRMPPHDSNVVLSDRGVEITCK